MLELIRTAPAIAAIVAAVITLASSGVAFVARAWIFDTFEKPALIQHQLELCKANVEAAAARATQEARDKYFQIGESLWREEARKAADDQAEHEAQVRQIREEAMDYVRGREEEDPDSPVCRPDARDVEHVERVWFKRGPTAPGHSSIGG